MSAFGNGSLVPFGEMSTAVQMGTIQAIVWLPYYDVGKDPAAALFCTVPFGFYNASQVMAWYYEYGGLDLAQNFYSNWNIHFNTFSASSGQIFGQTRKPYYNLDELKGKIFRSSGIQAETLKEAGMEVVVLPGAELFTALERGIIDVAEFVGPGWNWRAGFHEIAPYILTPGWHEPASMEVVLSNKDSYNELPDDLKLLLDTSIAYVGQGMAAYMKKDDAEAWQKMKDYGCTFIRLPDSDLATLEDAKQRVVDKYSASNAAFAEIIKSQQACIKEQQELTAELEDFSYTRP